MAKEELCFGVIPLKVIDEKVHVLLLLHRKGDYWGFPKGHADRDEEPQVAAQRELFEETDLKVASFLSLGELKEDYHFVRDGQEIHKYVMYYPAKVQGDVYLKEPEEIIDAKWFEVTCALDQITFSPSQQILKEILKEGDQLAVKIGKG